MKKLCLLILLLFFSFSIKANDCPSGPACNDPKRPYCLNIGSGQDVTYLCCASNATGPWSNKKSLGCHERQSKQPIFPHIPQKKV